MSCALGSVQQICMLAGGTGVLETGLPEGGWDAFKDFKFCVRFFAPLVDQQGHWPKVRTHKHASKHEMYRQIRYNYARGRTIAVFREGRRRYHCIVYMRGRKFADYIIEQSSNGEWHEVTAFMLGWNWKKIICWLMNKDQITPINSPLQQQRAGPSPWLSGIVQWQEDFENSSFSQFAAD